MVEVLNYSKCCFLAFYLFNTYSNCLHGYYRYHLSEYLFSSVWYLPGKAIEVCCNGPAQACLPEWNRKV